MRCAPRRCLATRFFVMLDRSSPVAALIAASRCDSAEASATPRASAQMSSENDCPRKKGSALRVPPAPHAGHTTLREELDRRRRAAWPAGLQPPRAASAAAGHGHGSLCAAARDREPSGRRPSSPTAAAASSRWTPDPGLPASRIVSRLDSWPRLRRRLNPSIRLWRSTESPIGS